MSETDNNALPPMNVFQVDSQGLFAWKAVFRSVTVSFVVGDVVLRMAEGESEECATLNPSEARHIAGLLLIAADQAEANLRSLPGVDNAGVLEPVGRNQKLTD